MLRLPAAGKGSDVGALRVSSGVVSDFSDARRLGRFVQRFLDATTESMGTEPVPSQAP